MLSRLLEESGKKYKEKYSKSGVEWSVIPKDVLYGEVLMCVMYHQPTQPFVVWRRKIQFTIKFAFFESKQDLPEEYFHR
jgi:hypothetical protein